MRSAARKPEQDIPGEPAREDPRVRGARIDAQYEAVLRSLEAGHASPDLIFELIATGRHYAGHSAALEKLLAAQYGEDRAFAAGIALGESRAAARARVPAPRPGWQRSALKVVRAVVPAGAIGLAAKILSAHRVLAPATLAAMIGGTAVIVQMQPARTVPDIASTAPAPAASIYDADPVASSPAALTRPRPRAAVVRSRPLLTHAPAAGPPSSRPPGASPSPSSLPAFLTAVPAQLDLAARLAGQITLSVSGGAVRWSASCDSACQDITLSFVPGTLRPGDEAYIRVSVAPGTSGSATVTVEPGDIRIPVSWLAGLPVALPSSIGL